MLIPIIDSTFLENDNIEGQPCKQTAYHKHVPVTAESFRRSLNRDIIYYAACCISGGALLLVNYWFPIFFTRLRRMRCAPQFADTLIIRTNSGSESLQQLESITVNREDLFNATRQYFKHTTQRTPRTRSSSESPCGFVPPSNYSFKNASTHAFKNSSINLLEDKPLLDVSIRVSDTVWVCTQSFEFLCRKFILIDNIFINAEFDIEAVPLSTLWTRHESGVKINAVQSLRNIFGFCEVIVPSRSSWSLILTECLSFFYLFQILSVTLWMVDGYYWYSIAITTLSIVSLISEIQETCENNANLQKMARFSCDVTIKRISGGEQKSLLLNSKYLVCGDLIEVQRGMRLPCDLLLFCGNVLVDESLMTGESTPVHKSPLPKSHELFSFAKHTEHVLYGGSVIQDISGLLNGQKAMAIVIRVGYATTQGDMMRRLVHNEQLSSTRLDFDVEAYKFVGLLAMISCFTFFWSIYQGVVNGLAAWTIIKRSLDTVTIAVPPALPIIVSVGTVRATKSLKKDHDTHCLMPSRINVSGRASVVVFDKTGTLTENDEDLLAVVPTVSYTRFEDSSLDTKNFLTLRPQSLSPRNQGKSQTNIEDAEQVPAAKFSQSIKSPSQLSRRLLTGLATCHSLRVTDGTLSGDRLEYQMVAFTGWQLIPPIDNTEKPECQAKDSIEDISIESFDYNHYWCVQRDVSLRDFSMGAMQTSITPDCSVTVLESSNLMNIYPTLTPAVESLSANDPMIAPVKADEYSFASTPDFAIIKIFGFDPALKRMTTVVRNLSTSELTVYCKGAPEMIRKLCTPESCPAEWDILLESYSRQGLRVLAIAERLMITNALEEVEGMDRCDVEAGLSFQALLLFVNLLRNDSREIIQELNEAGLCCYMATGDGLLTASAVGADAGIVPKSANTLIKGHLENKRLIWQKEDFETNLSMDTPSVTAGFVKAAAGNSRLHESNISTTLSPLLHGLKHSEVCLSITGEAFRYIVDEESDETEKSEECLHICHETFKDPSNLWGTTQKFGCMAKSRTVSRWLGVILKWFKRSHTDGKVQSIGLREFVLRYFQIFGRMSPDDKELLVHALQTRLANKPVVVMCGDGANDCAALRVADVGISLSSQEASVAAPFNSVFKSIRVVPAVLLEGRGALINSIQNFQFVAVYALVQLCTVSLLTRFGGYMCDRQFLYIDLIEVLPLTYFMSWSKTRTRLHQAMPPETLLAWSIVASLLGHILIQVAFQAVSVFVLLPIGGYHFYSRPPSTTGENFETYENTLLFLISNIQTVTIALVLALGTSPWKKVFSNFSFVAVFTLFTVLGVGLIMNEAPYAQWMRRFLELMSIPLNFRVQILAIVSLNLLSSLLFELGVVQAVRRSEYRKDSKALNRTSQRGGDCTIRSVIS